jgi:hypothetical protein
MKQESPGFSCGECQGHIQVMIPYSLYRRVLRFIRGHHIRASADEVVAEAVRAYLDRRGSKKKNELPESARSFFS